MSDPKPVGRHAAEVAYNCDFVVDRDKDLWVKLLRDVESVSDRQAAEMDDADLPEYFAPRPTLPWLAH